jgi:alpha-tubulin suppressor-like RCC1 family protein
VSAAYFFSCGFTTAGQGLCWGSNPRGELGNGTQTDALVPTALGGSLAITQISAGDSHGCAVTTDGRAWCWGENRLGQLGDGSTAQRLLPVPVAPPAN